MLLKSTWTPKFTMERNWERTEGRLETNFIDLISQFSHPNCATAFQGC